MSRIHAKQRSGRAVPSADDLAAVSAFAASQELHIISLRPNDNHWYYWIRGKLMLSNLASMYVITVNTRAGMQREIHIAITRGIFSRTMELKVLMERALA
jgi:hypothetical protein